jgi:hypothetical protein
MAPDLLRRSPEALGGRAGPSHNQFIERAAALRKSDDGDEPMADLFFAALIVALFALSALFIPLLRRN